jgi:hypothetical protein
MTNTAETTHFYLRYPGLNPDIRLLEGSWTRRPRGDEPHSSGLELGPQDGLETRPVPGRGEARRPVLCAGSGGGVAVPGLH